MKKLCPQKDASVSGVPTQVGTSDCRKFRRVSGLPGNLKKSAQVFGVIPTAGVPTQVGTSDYRKFRRVSGLPRSLKKSARVSGVIPTSGVPIKVGSFDCRELQHTRQKIMFGSGLLDSDPNCSKLAGNLKNKAWRGFLLG